MNVSQEFALQEVGRLYLETRALYLRVAELAAELQKPKEPQAPLSVTETPIGS